MSQAIGMIDKTFKSMGPLTFLISQSTGPTARLCRDAI